VKLHQLGTSFKIWAIVLGMSLPLCAGDRPGTITGYVRNTAGEPQMGALVQILDAADKTLTVFTDGAGYYTATGLLPGLYSLKVTAPSFLPASRENVGVHAGANIHVNVTLNTLLGIMQLGPVRNLPDEDDWKWTLRSVANRPIMRALDDPLLSSEAHHDDLKGTLSFFAGSAAGGYGTGSDANTVFTIEHSVFGEGRLALSGNVGYGAGTGVPAGVLRAAYSHKLDDGSEPTVAMTVRRFEPSDPNLHNAALQALALSASDDFTLGDVVELKFGSELQTIQFLGHVNAVRPYGRADIHVSPNTIVEYSFTTSRPDTREEKGFDSAPADMSETNPRVSVLNYAPEVESAHHNELSVSQRMGRNSLQVAVYSDHIANPALTGTGDVTAAGGFLLPDVSSGTFSYTGSNLDTGGMRVVLQHKFSSDLAATLDYAYGGALNLTTPDVALGTPAATFATIRRQALAAKLSGTLPGTHTHWITSYRWISGQALTPVDMFNASPGQSDPYLNLFIRQPIPSMGFLPAHMEAIIDVRNLLAQGYVPVIGQDGQTVYLVQAARSLRGGVAFTF
jgi:hypothetical protein